MTIFLVFAPGRIGFGTEPISVVATQETCESSRKFVILLLTLSDSYFTLIRYANRCSKLASSCKVARHRRSVLSRRTIPWLVPRCCIAYQRRSSGNSGKHSGSPHDAFEVLNAHTLSPALTTFAVCLRQHVLEDIVRQFFLENVGHSFQVS